jgi:hypothetical protein
MDSFEFFKNKEFNDKWKNKSGVYIVENPIFTRFVGFPVYKTGYARNSLYTRISNYRTAYGLVPFKIHAIYEVPEKVLGARVNYANLTERVLQETARKYGEYAGIGEWFKNLPILLNILKSINKKHLEQHKYAYKWEFFTFQNLQESLNPIELVSEDTIKGTFKDLIAGKHTRSGDNDFETIDAEEYELVALGKKGEAVKQTTIEKEPEPTKAKSRVKSGYTVTQTNKPGMEKEELIIHDGTKAKSYVGKRVKKFFKKTNKYDAGFYEGEVIGYLWKESNKYPTFEILFDDGYKIPPVSSVALFRMLI